MSNFHDATRQMLEADLVCPCNAVNVPGKPPVIVVEDDNIHAGCSQCGRYGRVTSFQRPKER